MGLLTPHVKHNIFLKYISIPLLCLLLTACANTTPLADKNTIRTAPLLQNVAHGNKTFIKGDRYRIVQLETGELGAILDAEIASALPVPMEAIYGVEIGKDGCTTGRRFYLHGDKGSVSSPMVDKDLKLWTPSSFCFDLSQAD